MKSGSSGLIRELFAGLIEGIGALLGASLFLLAIPLFALALGVIAHLIRDAFVLGWNISLPNVLVELWARINQ